MVKLNVRWKTAEDLNRLRGSSAWTKIKFFWRQGWTEIPVIMASTLVTPISLAVVCYVIHYYNTHDMTPKYYKLPRIYRPDDPAVQKIKHTSMFDQ